MQTFNITAEKGTRDSRPLFREPTRVTDGDLAETDEEWEKRLALYRERQDIRVSFDYLDNDRHDAWSDRAQQIQFDELKLIAKLKEEHGEELRPDVYRETFRSSQRREAEKAYAREYLAEVKVGLENVALGGRPSEKMEPAEVIELLIRMQWHSAAVAVIHRAQTPSVEQFLS